MPVKPMKNPPHIGRFIRSEIVEALGLNVTEAAKALDVTRQALNNLLNEKSALSEDMALRIEEAFGPPAALLMGMQTDYNLAQARLRASGRPPVAGMAALQLAAASKPIQGVGVPQSRSFVFLANHREFVAEADDTPGVKIMGFFDADWRTLRLGKEQYALEKSNADNERICPYLKMIDLMRVVRKAEHNPDMVPTFER